MKISLLVLCLFLNVLASEIDSYTALLNPRENSIEILNAEINKRLRKAAKRTKGCDLKKLRRKVFRRTGKGFFFSRIEVHANKLGKEYTFEAKFKESVYQGSPFFYKSPAFMLYGLGETLNINQHIVGSDKLGHFFHEGIWYLQKMEKAETLEQALEFGRTQERTYYGLDTTGVFSHADLVANFNGLRFWLALTPNGKLGLDDPLTGEKLQPYFECKNDQWELVRSFDWMDYIDHGWEEHINCSDYKGEKNQKVIARNIKSLLESSKIAGQTHCPVFPKFCVDLTSKYGQLSTSLLHPVCQR